MCSYFLFLRYFFKSSAFLIMRFPYITASFVCFFICIAPKPTKAQSVEFAVYDSFAQLEQRIEQGNERVLVINFWATWCKPCIKELPFFEALQSRYATKKLGVLLVSLDFKSQKDKRLLPFLERNQLCSEVALLADQDANFWIPQFHDTWDGAIPVTLVYNRKTQKKSFHKDKFNNFEELNSFVKSNM